MKRNKAIKNSIRMPLWDRGIRKYSDLTAEEMELIFGSSGMVNRIIGY